MDFAILLCGDSAVTVQIGDSVSEKVNQIVTKAVNSLQNHLLPGITELVPTYTTVCVHYDPLIISFEEVSEWIHQTKLDLSDAGSVYGRVVRIPVCYGGEYGPDLSFVAEHSGISEEELIRRHTSPTYLVYMLGFLPGFAYLGGMDESIACPRLLSPRTKIPAGSVGIAGTQTGIYPLDSPGGWQLIGRTPEKMFSLQGEETKFCLSAGDRVQFYAISEEEYQKMEERS